MSVNYDAYVVIGLAVKCKTVDTYETRYDEITGKPYQKKVSKDYWETTDHRPLGFDPCELEDRDAQKLQFFTSDSDRGGVVGCKLAQTSDDNIDGAVTVPDEEAQLFLWSNVVKQLEARGCTRKPELLLVMTCG